MLKWFRKKDGEATTETAVEVEARQESPSQTESEVGTEEPQETHAAFLARLKNRLAKSRERLADRVDRLVLGKKHIDAELIEDLEEILVTADLGVHTTQFLLDRVREKVKRKELQDPERLRQALREEMEAILSVQAPPMDPSRAKPFVIMMIGVNGVGKTTTIGKLAHRFRQDGLTPMLVAADTFRAAAAEQLERWAERIQVPIVRQQSGADPSAVVFDALDAAMARHVDVVLIDTAGRMHTKVNLMEELKKLHRVIRRKLPEAPHEILLVLDATTGQNAVNQARLFQDALGITGLILTKLDGTAKGGVIVPICQELRLPVRYIGLGEALDDLRPFDAAAFARAVL
ncbi:signal recognition particle-docking protein FtsY [Desulfosoma caldarium]|uniref:Signal recognition particle receptor FtsY n=1 Tax=Desulfosoma caldarium TaxID=610254 RepID=A0A3N1VL37_9BACT|nr:signal recognition particle-docking protein FtsY [Desulfosoma caldarium]ROR03503.1 signal recognition particle-docking protein FtsY [Desulfosoma caldarium]